MSRPPRTTLSTASERLDIENSDTAPNRPTRASRAPERRDSPIHGQRESGPLLATPGRGQGAARHDDADTDDKGIYRGQGLYIAWFKDPARQHLVRTTGEVAQSSRPARRRAPRAACAGRPPAELSESRVSRCGHAAARLPRPR